MGSDTHKRHRLPASAADLRGWLAFSGGQGRDLVGAVSGPVFVLGFHDGHLLVAEIDDVYREIEGLVFDLTIEDSDLKMKINSEIIEREFSKGSFPYEFLNGLAHDEEALQIAYDLVRRG